MREIFITGISSGIGEGLAKYYLDLGISVWGCARRKLTWSHPKLSYEQIDISNHDEIEKKLPILLENISPGHQVILNAGVLGTLSYLERATLSNLKETMNTNLWAQKTIIDTLFASQKEPSLIIALSSGAAVNGSKGWSGYSLSKAALNMLIKLYASEKEKTKFIAFAPGLVQTQMQDYLATQSAEEFPNLERIHNARGTDLMPNPSEFSPKFEKFLKKIDQFESGSFIDLRKI